MQPSRRPTDGRYGENPNHNALSFEIEGDLWAQPVPLRLLLQTDLDLESMVSGLNGVVDTCASAPATR